MGSKHLSECWAHFRGSKIGEGEQSAFGHSFGPALGLERVCVSMHSWMHVCLSKGWSTEEAEALVPPRPTGQGQADPSKL